MLLTNASSFPFTNTAAALQGGPFLRTYELVTNCPSLCEGAAAEIPMSHSDYDFGASDLTPISQSKM